MADFPTLSKGPNPQMYQDNAAGEAVLQTQFNSGAILARRKYTKVPRQKTLQFNYMTLADYNTMKAFEDANLGLRFNFTDPITGAVKEALLPKKGISYSTEPKKPSTHQFKFQLTVFE